MYLEQQNQQIVSLLAEQEKLRKELEDQKMAVKRDKYRQEFINREMEREALDLLEDYEQINVNLLTFQKSKGIQHSNNLGSLRSRREHPLSKSTPLMYPRSIDQQAQMIYPDKPQQPNLSELFIMMMMSDRMKEKSSPPQENKSSQLLLSSLDKQNRVLEKLTGTMGEERDRGYGREASDMIDQIRKTDAEKRYIEKKLYKKQLEIDANDQPDPLKL